MRDPTTLRVRRVRNAKISDPAAGLSSCCQAKVQRIPYGRFACLNCHSRLSREQVVATAFVDVSLMLLVCRDCRYVERYLDDGGVPLDDLHPEDWRPLIVAADFGPYR